MSAITTVRGSTIEACANCHVTPAINPSDATFTPSKNPEAHNETDTAQDQPDPTRVLVTDVDRQFG